MRKTLLAILATVSVGTLLANHSLAQFPTPQTVPAASQPEIQINSLEQPLVWDRPKGDKPGWLLSGEASNQEKVELQRIVAEKLNRKISVEFNNVPLRSAMETLSEELELGIVYDEVAMEGGISSPDDPVILEVKNVRVIEVLKLMCEPLQLAVKVEPEYLFVTTFDEGNAAEVRYYDLGYIIPSSELASDLLEVMHSSLPGDWGHDEDRLSVFGSLLIAKCSVETHDELERFLARIGQIPREELLKQAALKRKESQLNAPRMTQSTGGMF